MGNLPKKPNTMVKYEAQSKDDFGALMITGLVFPKNNVFALLDKIWSSVRKRIWDMYKVRVTGLFIEDEDTQVISCSFYLNYAMVKESDYDAYSDKFQETFFEQMHFFENVLESFILNDNGLKTYKKYLKSVDSIDPEKCNEILDEFLKSIGVKTEKDEVKKKKRKKRLEDLKK